MIQYSLDQRGKVVVNRILDYVALVLDMQTRGQPDVRRQPGTMGPLVFELDLVLRELFLVVVIIPLDVKRLSYHSKRKLVVREDATNTISTDIKHMPAFRLHNSRARV